MMKPLRFRKQNSGMTLLEITIVIVIFSVLGLTLMTLYAAGNTLMQVSGNKLTLQQEARLSLDRVLKELRQANPGSISVTGNQNAISFQVPQSIDPNSGAISWSSTVSYSVGGVNNAQLLRTQAGLPNTVMANDINNDLTNQNRLKFTLDQTPNPNAVTITMSMRRTTLAGHAAQAVLVGEAKVRNP